MSSLTCARAAAPLVRFLPGERSAGISGQVVRRAGTELHVVGLPFPTASILRREPWDVDAVATAVAEVPGGHRKPCGLEKRLPPGLRRWPAPTRVE